MAPAFPSGSNLGAMIAPHCADEQPWLIEVTPGGGQRVLSYGDLRDGAGAGQLQPPLCCWSNPQQQ
jgi:hypothetical protein